MKKIILSAAIVCAFAFTVPMVMSAQTKEAPKTTKEAPKPMPAKVENPCKGPANLVVTPKEKGFTAKWDAVEGAKGYEVSIRDVDGKHGINNYSTATATYATSTLNAGTDYTVHVVSKGCAAAPGNRPSEPSNKVKFKTPGIAPASKPATSTKEPVKSAPTKSATGK